MKHLQTITAGIASALVFNAFACAEGILAPDNPYTLIETRNIFGLVPAVANQSPQPTAPPVPEQKIICNGITSLFGPVQVLFKVVSPVKSAGNQTSETTYLLSEGQQLDDIEVIHIDSKAGLVIFKNHGTVQSISLTNVPTVSLPTTRPTPSQILFQKTHPNG